MPYLIQLHPYPLPMTGFGVDEFATFDEFFRVWAGDNKAEARMLWQLLGELNEDELLITLPEWLAEEKVGYTDGRTPTGFVGRISRETEKAILFEDSAAARPLMSLAHRIHSLEDGLSTTGADDDRRGWLERRLQEKRAAFRNRDDVGELRDEWLPKSQVITVVRRTE